MLLQRQYSWWHGRLADYFEHTKSRDTARRAEELPYHLEKVLDNNRLMHCLLEWETFEQLLGGHEEWDEHHCPKVCTVHTIH
jgi:hypothetical protein